MLSKYLAHNVNADAKKMPSRALLLPLLLVFIGSMTGYPAADGNAEVQSASKQQPLQKPSDLIDPRTDSGLDIVVKLSYGPLGPSGTTPDPKAEDSYYRSHQFWVPVSPTSSKKPPEVAVSDGTTVPYETTSLQGTQTTFVDYGSSVRLTAEQTAGPLISLNVYISHFTQNVLPASGTARTRENASPALWNGFKINEKIVIDPCQVPYAVDMGSVYDSRRQRYGTAQLEIVHALPGCKKNDKAVIKGNHRFTVTEVESVESDGRRAEKIATELTMIVAEDTEVRIEEGSTVPYFTESSGGTQTTFVDVMNKFNVRKLNPTADTATFDYDIRLDGMIITESANPAGPHIGRHETGGKITMKKGESKNVYRVNSGKATRTLVIKYLPD